MGTLIITLKNDYRVTKFGRILRKTKLNEDPQLSVLPEAAVRGGRPPRGVRRGGRMAVGIEKWPGHVRAPFLLSRGLPPRFAPLLW